MRTIKNQVKFAIRKPVPDDVARLLELVKRSTGGKTTLTKESLHYDLFGFSEKIVRGSNTANDIYESISSLSDEHSNKPVCQAFVAHHNSTLVGYVIYHYYYSPWDGHEMFVDDVYVSEEFRRRGIASKLLDEVFRICIVENLKGFIFSLSYLNADLLSIIKKHRKTFTVRGNESDWSVYRVDFQN